MKKLLIILFILPFITTAQTPSAYDKKLVARIDSAALRLAKLQSDLTRISGLLDSMKTMVLYFDSSKFIVYRHRDTIKIFSK